MTPPLTLSQSARQEVRRIVLISRVAGALVAAALAVGSMYIYWGDFHDLDFVFQCFTVVAGTVAFVSLSTISRIGHVGVLERSLQEVQSLSEQLRDMAERDSLTGLYNLRAFHEQVEEEIRAAARDAGAVSLIVADLDGFKTLNDAYGHQFGDEVLRATGTAFAAASGPGGAAARLGGDEFALLLPGARRDDAAVVAQSMEASLGVIRIGGRPVAAVGSFGIGVFPDDGDSAQALFAAADGRMYSEKHRRKVESLSTLAGAARTLFVRAGRALCRDHTTTRILHDIAEAAREELALSLCLISVGPRAQHPALTVASAGASEPEGAFLGAASYGRVQTPTVVQMLPQGTWVIEAPIRDEDGENGTMILAGMPTTSFRPDAAVVLALADMVQAVVANGRAHVDAVRLGRERDIHIDVAHAVAGSEPLRDRLSTVTKLIAEFVGATAVSIEGLQAFNSSLTYNMTSGASARFLERWDAVRTSDEGLAFVRAIAAEAPCILDDPAHDPRVPEGERVLLDRAGVRTSAICPIRLDGQLLGILAAVSTTPDFFNEDIVAMLMTITDHLAPAISVALLRDALELSYVQLEQASRESLARLAYAAEARDPHTGGHLRRIRHYCVALALEVGLDADEADAIGAASTIHDLGKLSLSDDVLHKPGRLTPGDWDRMREHPGHGERLIGDSPKFELERAVARWHHERWDGTGYPDALSGEKIPLAARIVAVADAFDALTTDRPYKRAWSLDEACDEVLRMRGRLFCPRVVEALEALRRSGRLAQMFAEVEGREQETPRTRAAA